MSFEGWLDARDGDTLAREWGTLGVRGVELGVHPRFVLGIQPEAAALLAAAWLGCSVEQFSWVIKEEGKALPERPPPIFEVGREVARCFFDGELCTEADLSERWIIHEVREGARGIQFAVIDYFYGQQTRDGGGGGSATIVRLFDRNTGRGASVRLWSNEAFTIGEIDLAPLDLFAHRVSYKLPQPKLELAAIRGFVAQLTADLDAHFDTSTEWEGGVTRDEILTSEEYNFKSRRRELVFRSGPYSIELGENLDADDPDDDSAMFWIVVRGLPAGHEVNIRIALSHEPDFPIDGWIDFTLPLAQLEAAVARAAQVPGIQLL